MNAEEDGPRHFASGRSHRVFTIDANGEAMLLLFDFQEEGEFRLHAAAPEADWRPREATAGDPVSSLLGLLPGAR